MASKEFAIYITAFLGPFLQEDAAIIGAVTAFLHPETNVKASGVLILSAMFCGLVISDLWKYWIGWAGRTQVWAQKMALRPSVQLVGEKIMAHPGKTLMFARFVPGTRIPCYIAAGFFRVAFGRFVIWIVVSAVCYCLLTILLLGVVGAVAGQKAQIYVAGTLILALVCYVIYSALRARLGESAK